MSWYTPLAIALVRSKLPEGELAISYEYFENTLSRVSYLTTIPDFPIGQVCVWNNNIIPSRLLHKLLIRILNGNLIPCRRVRYRSPVAFLRPVTLQDIFLLADSIGTLSTLVFLGGVLDSFGSFAKEVRDFRNRVRARIRLCGHGEASAEEIEETVEALCKL